MGLFDFNRKKTGDGLGEVINGVTNNIFDSLGIMTGNNSIKLDYKRLDELYTYNWIVSKIVNKLSQDCTKRWRTFAGENIENDELQELSKTEESIALKETAERALKLTSLHGSALVLFSTTGNPLIADPISYYNSGMLPHERITKLTLFRADQFEILELDDDILSDTYLKPLKFKLKDKIVVTTDNETKEQDLIIDHSRAYFFSVNNLTLKTPQEIINKKGISDIQLIIEEILNFGKYCKESPKIVKELTLDLFKLDKLNQQISANGARPLIEWLRLNIFLKKSKNVLLLDKDSEYERKQLSTNNVAELWQKGADVLAGATDIPKTILFGEGASGFSSGSEDTRSYFDKVASLQSSRLKPFLEKVDNNIFQDYKENNLTFSFNHIAIQTDLERATTMKSFVEIANALVVGNLTTLETAQDVIAQNTSIKITDDDRELDSEITDYELPQPPENY